MRNLTENVVLIVVFSPFFMWLLPFGSFDPSTKEFYLSIVACVFVIIGAKSDAKKGLKWLANRMNMREDSKKSK